MGYKLPQTPCCGATSRSDNTMGSAADGSGGMSSTDASSHNRGENGIESVLVPVMDTTAIDSVRVTCTEPMVELVADTTTNGSGLSGVHRVAGPEPVATSVGDVPPDDSVEVQSFPTEAEAMDDSGTEQWYGSSTTTHLTQNVCACHGYEKS
ncbi:hypothetical protein V6N11_052386 [Hibiscus sabdariffa]|uniref:Uncharacterized protein n=1 Tax=Hibiscus sabdariffa TaxID=183260 RepID=A0ABR2UA69_9ROSI